MELAVEQAAAGLPRVEWRGLGHRMRREAASIALNVGEACLHRCRRGRLHHLSLARGALVALEAEVESARQLRYLTHASGVHLERGCDRLARLLGREVLALYAVPPTPRVGQEGLMVRLEGLRRSPRTGEAPNINEI